MTARTPPLYRTLRRPVLRCGRAFFSLMLACAATLLPSGCLPEPSVGSSTPGSPAAEGWRGVVASSLEVLPREHWRASQVRGKAAALGKPRRLTIHHSAGPTYTRTEIEKVSASLRAIQHDHQTNRAWVDIGYHYIVDPAGRIWEGRSNEIVGAHAGSAQLNESNLGLLLLGNFDEQEPTVSQTSSLWRLVDVLTSACSISDSAVETHREVRAGGGLTGTQCPGERLQRRVEAWRARQSRGG